MAPISAYDDALSGAIPSWWRCQLTIQSRRAPRSTGRISGHAAFLVTAADPGPDISAIIASRLNAPRAHARVIVQDVGRENLLTFVTERRSPRSPGSVPFSTYPDGLVLREIHDAFGPTRLDQSVHWRGDNDNPALRQFLKLLSQRYARPIPGQLKAGSPTGLIGCKSKGRHDRGCVTALPADRAALGAAGGPARISSARCGDRIASPDVPAATSEMLVAGDRETAGTHRPEELDRQGRLPEH